MQVKNTKTYADPRTAGLAQMNFRKEAADGAPAPLSLEQGKSILYLAVCATIIPYLLCLYGQKRVSTTTSGILLSFESVFATAMSIVVLHEHISLQFVAGGVLVIGAAVLSEWKFKNKKSGTL